jgi:hypothetical protein
MRAAWVPNDPYGCEFICEFSFLFHLSVPCVLGVVLSVAMFGVRGICGGEGSKETLVFLNCS